MSSLKRSTPIGAHSGFNSMVMVPSVVSRVAVSPLAALAGKVVASAAPADACRTFLRVGKERQATPSRHEAATVRVMVLIPFCASPRRIGGAMVVSAARALLVTCRSCGRELCGTLQLAERSELEMLGL